MNCIKTLAWFQFIHSHKKPKDFPFLMTMVGMMKSVSLSELSDVGNTTIIHGFFSDVSLCLSSRTFLTQLSIW